MKNTAFQQYHAGCGGRIIVLGYNGEMRITCDRCLKLWDLPATIELADDWQDPIRQQAPQSPTRNDGPRLPVLSGQGMGLN